MKTVKYSLLIISLILTFSVIYSGSTSRATFTNNTEVKVEQIMAEMTLEEKVGQLLFPAFSGNQLNTSNLKLIEKLKPGGLIFFPHNLNGLKGTFNFIEGLQKDSKLPLLISIDQEGGLIQKLKKGVERANDFPGAMALGATGSEELTQQLSNAMAKELKAAGFNTVFAPSLDVNSNPDNPVIGIRSFSDNPELVSELGLAYIKGLQKENIIPVAKHFPGHGDTATDTHLGTATIPYKMERLREVELKPFKKAVENDIEMIMTAHITVPGLDPSGKPATLSKKILTDLLRKEWNYNGVVITDAMNMKAISNNYGKNESVVMAIKAGADMVLMPIDPYQAKGRLLKAIKTGQLSEERIDRSVKRIITLKVKKELFKSDQFNDNDSTVNWERNKEIAQQTANQAVTVVRDELDLLPLSLQSDEKVAVVTPSYKVARIYKEELKKVFPNNKIDTIIDDKLNLTTAQYRLMLETDLVIVATNGSSRLSRKPTHPQMTVVKKLLEKKRNKTIWIGLKTPYELSTFPDAPTFIAQYGYNPTNSRASIKLITGQIETNGQLPVKLP